MAASGWQINWNCAFAEERKPLVIGKPLGQLSGAKGDTQTDEATKTVAASLLTVLN